ncbi:hypothetical protein [Sinomicrobium sp. M5D2P9]
MCYVVLGKAPGTVVKKNTDQGCSDTSARARGQAWGLYSYTMCYLQIVYADYYYPEHYFAKKICGEESQLLRGVPILSGHLVRKKLPRCITPG